MDKLQKNVRKLLTIKALKDIAKIVDDDKKQQEDETLGARIVIGFVVVIIIFTLYNVFQRISY